MREPIKIPSVAIPKGTVFEFPDGSISKTTGDAYLVGRREIESVAVNKMRFQRRKMAKAVMEGEVKE